MGRGRQDGFSGVRGRFGGTDGPLSPMAWKVGLRGELSAGSFPQHERLHGAGDAGPDRLLGLAALAEDPGRRLRGVQHAICRTQLSTGGSDVPGGGCLFSLAISQWRSQRHSYLYPRATRKGQSPSRNTQPVNRPGDHHHLEPPYTPQTEED